jgi:outer membrane receptor for ferrienterochelin and colicin
LDVREGNNKQLSGNLDVSLTGGALVAEGPLSPSVTGLASVRSTFSNYVSRYLPNGSSRNPSYYDALARTDIVADERNHVSLQVLRSYDKTSGIARGEYGTTLISLQAHHALGQSDTLQGTISTTWQSENLSRPLGIFDPKTGNNVSTISDIIQKETSLQYQASVTKQYAILMGGRLQRSGYQGTRISVVRTLRGDSVSQGDLDHEMTRASGFVENIVQIDRVLVNGGVRLDYASLIDEAKVSPRFLISYRFPSSTTIKGACGVYYQSPNYQQLLAARSSSLPFPHMQRATHYTIGLEQPLRSDLSLRIDAYIKTMEDVISFERFRSGEIIYSPRNDARANVKGVEFEASFSDPKVFGWMNVAVMRAEERNYYDSFGWRFSPTDQRKTVTLVFELRPAERFSMNIRAFYGSGFAYLNDAPDSLIDPRKHYPEYKRADVRASYTIKFSDRLSSTIYLEAMNIFGYRNAYSFRGAITDPSNPDVNLLLPTIINVGVRADF